MEQKDSKAKHAPKDVRTGNKSVQLSGPFIKVSVDGKTTPAIIHKDVLCATSQFFKSAAKPEWSELRAEPHDLKLPIDQPAADAFPVYQHWLYSGKLPISGEPVPQVFESLAKAYALGEVLLDTRFRNDVIDTIIVTWNECRYSPMGKPVAIIYEGTPPGSPARRLVSEMCAFMFHDHPSWMNELGHCPTDFFGDVLKVMAKFRNGTLEPERPWPWEESCEGYHEKEAK